MCSQCSVICDLRCEMLASELVVDSSYFNIFHVLHRLLRQVQERSSPLITVTEDVSHVVEEPLPFFPLNVILMVILSLLLY